MIGDRNGLSRADHVVRLVRACVARERVDDSRRAGSVIRRVLGSRHRVRLSERIERGLARTGSEALIIQES